MVGIQEPTPPTIATRADEKLKIMYKCTILMYKLIQYYHSLRALLNISRVSMTRLGQIDRQSLTRRVLYHLPNWKILTQDNWVLCKLYRIALWCLQTPHQAQHPPPTTLSLDNRALVTQEVHGADQERDYHLLNQFCFPDLCGQGKNPLPSSLVSQDTNKQTRCYRY